MRGCRMISFIRPGAEGKRHRSGVERDSRPKAWVRRTIVAIETGRSVPRVEPNRVVKSWPLLIRESESLDQTSSRRECGSCSTTQAATTRI